MKTFMKMVIPQFGDLIGIYFLVGVLDAVIVIKKTQFVKEKKEKLKL